MKAPSPCASGNGRSNTVRPRNSVPRCTNNPVPPTMANIRKRSVTTSLVNFASTSPRKSSATMESSLLSPCRREPKVKGISTVLSSPCAVATMSSRILKPCVESCGASCSKRSRADHEEAAHGIGDGNRERAPGDGSCKGAGARPAPVETVGAAAFDIAAADHELGLPALQQREHLRQLRLVMLQVGVHHGGIGRAGGEDAFDAGARQAAAADAADAADAAVLSRETAHHLPGAVRRIVVDEDHFPGDAGERGLELAIKLGHIVALVEGGDDDRKRRQVGACLRRVSARSDGFIHARSVYPPHPAMPSCQKPGSAGPNAPKSAEKGPKCQRPRTTGARTSGAALLLRGRPGDGALKHRHRLDTDMGTARRVPQGGHPANSALRG